jgi:prepilin-type N-terminal cleavage/methylation domain-containing protein
MTYPQTKKAFTLLEILIATTLFSVIMIMTTGIIGQSAGFRSKLQVMREASSASRKLADQITRDVREAHYSGKVLYGPGSNGTTEATYPRGIALFACSETSSFSCLPKNYKIPPAADTGDLPSGLASSDQSNLVANVLLLFGYNPTSTYKSVKIYVQKYDGTFFLQAISNGDTINVNKVFYGDAGYRYWATTDDYLISGKSGTKTIGNNIKTVLKFGGFGPQDGQATARPWPDPYVVLGIRATNLTTTTAPSEKASTTLRTLIAPRDYGN